MLLEYGEELPYMPYQLRMRLIEADRVCTEHSYGEYEGLDKKLENGNTVSLKKYFDDFGWDSGKVYMTEDFMPCLVKAMAKLPLEEIFVHAADVLANKPGMDNFWEEIDKIEDEAGIKQLITILSETAGEFGGGAGKYLKKMQAAEEKDDWEGFSTAIKEAVSICLSLSGILKCYAEIYAKRRMEKNVREKQTVSVEMQVLAAQVKTQIRMLLSQGMRREALQVLEQLKNLVPDDKEFSELEREGRKEN